MNDEITRRRYEVKIDSFDLSLAATDAHDPQSFIDGAKYWAEKTHRDALEAARYRDLKAKLEAMPRYELHDMWNSATMRPDEYGQWIKREDIAAIFSAEKKENQE